MSVCWFCSLFIYRWILFVFLLLSLTGIELVSPKLLIQSHLTSMDVSCSLHFYKYYLNKKLLSQDTPSFLAMEWWVTNKEPWPTQTYSFRIMQENCKVNASTACWSCWPPVRLTIVLKNDTETWGFGRPVAYGLIWQHEAPRPTHVNVNTLEVQPMEPLNTLLASMKRYFINISSSFSSSLQPSASYNQHLSGSAPYSEKM